MKIIKKLNHSIPREDAHAGSGKRKLYVSNDELENEDFQALAHGFLPGKSKFGWHHHDGIEEVMLVLRGEGIVRDRDGEYTYSQGDLFIYPQNVEHEIENPTSEEHEYVFVRIKT